MSAPSLPPARSGGQAAGSPEPAGETTKAEAGNDLRRGAFGRFDAPYRPMRPFDPAKHCGATKKSGGLCQQPKGAGTKHTGYGHCWNHLGNTPTGEAHAERERVAAQRAAIEKRLRELAKSGNVLSELEIAEGDVDGVASLKHALRLAEWWEQGLRAMVLQRDQLHGVNHLGDQAEDIVAQMHREAIDQVAKIAKDLAALTTGTKVSIESRLAPLAKYDDDELDAAIAEAEAIVAAAKGQA